jgi:hypothetical protein
LSPYFALTLGILCVWRVTHLFAAEDGPGDVFVRLRRALGQGFWGRLLDCFYCLSLWIAVPFAYLLADSWRDRALFWLACSGGACLLERLTQRAAAEVPAAYVEDPDTTEHHGVLRKE